MRKKITCYIQQPLAKEVIAYLYPENWRVTEYGVDSGLTRYKSGMSREEAIKTVKELFTKNGFVLKEQKTREADYMGAVIVDALMIQP